MCGRWETTAFAKGTRWPTGCRLCPRRKSSRPRANASGLTGRWLRGTVGEPSPNSERTRGTGGSHRSGSASPYPSRAPSITPSGLLPVNLVARPPSSTNVRRKSGSPSGRNTASSDVLVPAVLRPCVIYRSMARPMKRGQQPDSAFLSRAGWRTVSYPAHLLGEIP